MKKIHEIRNSTAEFLIFLAENKEDGVPIVYNKSFGVNTDGYV